MGLPQLCHYPAISKACLIFIFKRKMLVQQSCPSNTTGVQSKQFLCCSRQKQICSAFMNSCTYLRDCCRIYNQFSSRHRQCRFSIDLNAKFDTEMSSVYMFWWYKCTGGFLQNWGVFCELRHECRCKPACSIFVFIKVSHKFHLSLSHKLFLCFHLRQDYPRVSKGLKLFSCFSFSTKKKVYIAPRKNTADINLPV